MYELKLIVASAAWASIFQSRKNRNTIRTRVTINPAQLPCTNVDKNFAADFPTDTNTYIPKTEWIQNVYPVFIKTVNTGNCAESVLQTATLRPALPASYSAKKISGFQHGLKLMRTGPHFLPPHTGNRYRFIQFLNAVALSRLTTTFARG